MAAYCAGLAVAAALLESALAVPASPAPEVIYYPAYCHHTDPITPVPLVKDAELLQVTVLHRHGDRVMYAGGGCWEEDAMEGHFECTLNSAAAVVENTTEGKTLVNNRIFEHIYAPREPIPYKGCDVGQLTRKGQKMQIETGAALRKLYVDSGFLSPQLKESEVYLRADTVPRVVQSLESLVNGMFPRKPKPANDAAVGSDNTRSARITSQAPDFSIYRLISETDSEAATREDVRGDEANQLLDIEFVPLNVINIDLDATSDTVKFCPKAARYKELAWAPETATPERLAFERWREDTFERARAAGLPNHRLYSDKTDLYSVWDCVCVHLCHGFPTPMTTSGDEKAIFDELERVFVHENRIAASYPSPQAYSRVGVGILLREWVARWKSAVLAAQNKKAEPYHKFAEYSGHDSTMIWTLTALAFKDFAWPRYSSVAQFELYKLKSTGRTYMRLVYNFKVLELPFCGKANSLPDGLCDMDTVLAYFDTITPDDVAEECTYNDDDVPDGVNGAGTAPGLGLSTAIPLWMFATTALLCLGAGSVLGLVVTKRMYSKRLAHAARSGFAPLNENDDMSDDERE